LLLIYIIVQGGDNVLKANEKRLVGYLMDLLRIQSNPCNEREIADYLLLNIRSMGFNCYEDSSKFETGSNSGNIIVENCNNPNSIKLAFCSHMDTINIDQPVKFHIDNRSIFGDTTSAIGIDNKAGAAIMLEVLSILKENDSIARSINFIFTTCEEEGSAGAKAVDSSLIEDSYIYVLDSGSGPIGRVVNRGAGQTSFCIKFYGKESHPSNYSGINAVCLAAHFACNIKSGVINDKVTLNISKFNGGLSKNTIPSLTEVKGEILWWDKEKLYDTISCIRTALEDTVSNFGGSYSFDFVTDCSVLNVEENADIIKIAQKACAKAELNYSTGTTGCGSDAHVFCDRGFSSLKVSIGMKNVHTREEQINIDDLVDSVKYVLSIIACCSEN
jgi:tripeptide aminopeptidase